MGRRLTEAEMNQCRLVFGTALDLSAVRIIENSIVAKFISVISRGPTAFCLGNKLRFPRVLNTGLIIDMAWAIHELTHAWQFQTRGWIYLFEALWTEIRLGPKAYDYGGEAGLASALATGKGIYDFTPDQQGDIARHFYIRLQKRQNTEKWEPFVEDIRRSRK